MDELEKRNRRIARQDKIDDADVQEVIKTLLGLPKGRKFFWWLLEQTQQGQQPFTSNALTTAFNCGELNVGQKVLARMVELDPVGYVTMLQERNDVRRKLDPDAYSGPEGVPVDGDDSDQNT
jgi:hypothetical protein